MVVKHVSTRMRLSTRPLATPTPARLTAKDRSQHGLAAVSRAMGMLAAVSSSHLCLTSVCLYSGLDKRSFRISQPALHGGQECDYDDGQQQSNPCNDSPCPVSAVLGIPLAAGGDCGCAFRSTVLEHGAALGAAASRVAVVLGHRRTPSPKALSTVAKPALMLSMPSTRRHATPTRAP